MRLLIAEDDITYRRILDSLLRKWGHEVEVAALAHEVREPLVRREHLLVGRAADDVRGPLVA